MCGCSTHRLAELRATGTPFLPPERLIDLYRHFESQAPGLGPAVERYAAVLSATTRITVEHNDLHDGNVFARNGRIFDWGDAVITHPFLSVRMFESDWSTTYFDQWRVFDAVADSEIDAARRLAPLVGLRPWLSVDTSTGPWAEAVAALLGLLRTALTP